MLLLIQSSDLVRRLSEDACDSFEDAFRTVRNFIVRMRESIQRDRAKPPMARRRTTSYPNPLRRLNIAAPCRLSVLSSTRRKQKPV